MKSVLLGLFYFLIVCYIQCGYANIEDNMLYVEADINGESTIQGNAFIVNISNERYIVTCNHIVKNAKTVTFVDKLGNFVKLESQALSKVAGQDLAFFHMNAKLFSDGRGFILDTSFGIIPRPATEFSKFFTNVIPYPSAYTFQFSFPNNKNIILVCCCKAKLNPNFNLQFYTKSVNTFSIMGNIKTGSDYQSKDLSTIINIKECEVIGGESGSPIVFDGKVIGVVCNSDFELPEHLKKPEAYAVHSIEILECLKRLYSTLGFSTENIVSSIRRVGNCLFDAIADSDNEHRTGEELRRLAVAYIEENLALRNDIQAAVSFNDSADYLITPGGLTSYRSFEEYIRLMRLDQTWGTDREVTALAHVLRRPIIVFVQGFGIRHSEPDYDDRPAIELDFIGNHYRRHILQLSNIITPIAQSQQLQEEKHNATHVSQQQQLVQPVIPIIQTGLGGCSL